MNCHRIQKLMSAYVDSELPGVEMLAFRQHISGCADCRQEFESTLRIKRSVASMRTQAPPEYLAVHICLRLTEVPAQERSGLLHAIQRYFAFRSFPSGMKLAGTAAGILAILFALTWQSEDIDRGYSLGWRPVAIHRTANVDPFAQFSLATAAEAAPAYIPTRENSLSEYGGFFGGPSRFSRPAGAVSPAVYYP